LPPGWRQAAAAYSVGGLAYSTVITIATIVEAWPAVPAAIASVFWVNLWPLVPVLGLLLALRWTQTLWLAALFVIAGSLLIVVVTLIGEILRGAFDTAPLTNVYWSILQLVLTVYVPAFVLLLISRRRIRAVFAMTLAATILFGVGLMVFRRVALELFGVARLRSLILEVAVKTTNDVAYYAIYLLLAVPVGWVVWRVLRQLAVAFERKAFSDVQLVVDCWFAVVTMELLVTQLTNAYGLAGIAIGVGAFLAYRASVEFVLRIWPPAAPAKTATAPRLLLLRVFGHQARTEGLFDYIARHWRFRGPVQLIAGADLAMRTVDPGDVLAFVSGRLRSQYVTSTSEVSARVQRIDMQPDPDGRFRVNELYCLHDTWKAALQSLLTVTDAVVMDLRGFSRESRGCLYELRQLATTMATDRIVLIADDVTDKLLLEETLGRAWEQVSQPSAAMPSIALFKVDRNSARELGAVMNHLLRLVQPAPAGVEPFASRGQ
jgi:hypothetical protein